MEVDDAVQMIWTQVWDYAGTKFESRGPGSFYGLVGSIADRVLISLMRDGRAQKRGEGRECEGLSTENVRQVTLRPGLSSEPTPTSVARTNEDQGRLQLLLSEEQYTVFHDIEVRGLTAEDVSLVLDKTPSAVRGILRRARLRLVREFEEEKS
jgi:DNA-directed RNA polymerase specialized sigma24 family protein